VRRTAALRAPKPAGEPVKNVKIEKRLQEARPEAVSFARSLPKATYMLGLVDFVVASSHDIFAFSHAALVVGVLVLPAMVGAAKAITSPSETIAATILFIDFTPLLVRDRETGSAPDLS